MCKMYRDCTLQPDVAVAVTSTQIRRHLPSQACVSRVRAFILTSLWLIVKERLLLSQAPNLINLITRLKTSPHLKRLRHKMITSCALRKWRSHTQARYALGCQTSVCCASAAGYGKSLCLVVCLLVR